MIDRIEWIICWRPSAPVSLAASGSGTGLSHAEPTDFADFFGGFISGAPIIMLIHTQSQMQIQVDVMMFAFQWSHECTVSMISGFAEIWSDFQKGKNLVWSHVTVSGSDGTRRPMASHSTPSAMRCLRCWGFEKYPSERWDVATNAERWFHMRFLFQHGNEWLKMTDWWFPIPVSVLSKKW